LAQAILDQVEAFTPRVSQNPGCALQHTGQMGTCFGKLGHLLQRVRGRGMVRAISNDVAVIPSASAGANKVGHPSVSSGKPRVLITGATGNLGREVLKVFTCSSYEVRGLSSRPRPGPFKVCDLTKDGDVWEQVQDFKPHVVLHLAAERKPDEVQRDPSRAEKLNLGAVGSLSEACRSVGSWMVFISTDYVFDGTAPPYGVDAVPNPLSDYGKQKVDGERIALREPIMATVLRIPLLYGHVDKLEDSPVTELYAKLQKGLAKADDLQKRYPTYTRDVARVLRAMIDARQQGAYIGGIFHWQGSECLTKYKMIHAMSNITGIDVSSVAPDVVVPSAPRPADSRLDCSRLEQLLGGDPMRFRTPFREALKECLQPLVSNL